MTDPITRLTTALQARYTIERELGEGGMATVYLADDLKHDRKVALKVLKPELAAVVGAERFLAEIKTTANLQHPHILPLFDSGEADGFLYYVMPYVEGETLQDRLEREKQLPVDEAVRITTEVADALQSAHEQGVIHRDIKPANILLSRGRPLVANFGIALAVSAAGGGRLTETGLSLGTPYYMSPEQASADRDPSAASDVYSLGCVLYEMLVGEPPYTGGSAQAVLVKILTGDTPAPAGARASIPGNVDAAIRKALEKLPADRFRGAEHFARALADPAFSYGEEGEGAAAATKGWLPRSLLAIASGLAIVTLALGWWLGQRSARSSVEPGEAVRFTLPVPGGYENTISNEIPALAISPDGQVIVYREGGLLMRRVLSEETAERIPGTEGAESPFFSPDGEWLGFLLDAGLKRWSSDGVTTSMGGGSRIDQTHGVDWGEDDAIVFAQGFLGIWRVSVEGGEPAAITDPSPYPAEQAHMWPQSLEGGSLLLFSAIGPSGNWHDSKIVLKDLATGTRTTVVENGAYGRYVPSGHIVYATGDGTIQAVSFDLETREAGPSFPIESDVLLGQWGGGATFVISPSGTLVLVRGDSSQRHLLEWYDRSGDFLGQLGPPMTAAWGLEVDSAGRRVATALPNTRTALVHLLEENVVTPRPLTSDEGSGGWPVWSPDGHRLAWQQDVDGKGTVWVRDVDGGGQPVEVYSSQNQVWPRDWSPDRRWLAVSERLGSSGMDIILVDMENPGEVEPFLEAPFDEWDAQFSPEGRHLAFDSKESGTYKTHVISFPRSGDAIPVSTGKAQHPRWSPTRNELYFWSDTTLMAARYRTEPRFAIEEVGPLFSVGEYVIGGDPAYDVHPDGERFLIQVHNPDAAVREIHVVLNWLTVVRERAGG